MIKVKHCDGLFLIWNADDAIRLRKDHRIAGNLNGALPEFPRQTQDCGLPLVLMPEEVRLLSKLSAITIITEDGQSEKHSHFRTDECQSHYRQLQSKQYSEINERFKSSRKAEIEANLEKIVQGKMRKANVNFDDRPQELATFRDKIRTELLDAIQDVPQDSNSLLTRFYNQSPFPRASTNEFQLPVLAPFSLEAIKFAVYEDFWQKGYYLSDGLKFGAHFLAYDHDPLVFHAKFIIVCSPVPQDAQTKQNIIQAYGRLGKNVRKNVVLASFDQITKESADKPTIVYQHIQWNPIGLA